MAGVEDDADPAQLDLRGIYFDSSDYLTIVDFMQAQDFTINSWIRLDLASEHTLYSI